ncbi:iron uptake system component EfeO [Corynebacterium appendicis CIP 107643]|uniref:Iron uptake system component EfeO n=1 Tax=Corynebacterium appendicis CIP 107643 TaxID=1161099 RepID=A0A1N7JQ18_9CORY|nr:imelysin family protein [Corynebacterium appendicis]WJY61704.1 Efem/EfeO family lipoprotein precursor [Corynebacterium appendicis CIP 107643]SIS51438.1 iron uptake system component EfeO [Corynebacterium appendicis CIP 107643]
MNRFPSVLAATTLTFTLSGCAQATAGETIEVTATDTECAVAVDSVEAGTSTFEVENSAGAPLAFFVLAPGGGRVYASRDNIMPGSSADLTVSLDPGDYATACKLGWRGPDIGPAEFTVTGDTDTAAEGSAEEQLETARDNYVTFARRELAEFLPQVEDFAEAYAAGDDARAKQLYPAAREKYMRISPLAVSVGVLDERINAREEEYRTQAGDLKERDQTFTEWLGFHRIEKDLWPELAAETSEPEEPTTPRERREIADTLIGDVEQLKMTVDKSNFIEARDITMDTIVRGALRKTGQPVHDAHDAIGAVHASRAVFEAVKDLAADRGEEGSTLVSETENHLDSLQRSAETAIGELENPETAGETGGGTAEKSDVELSQLNEDLARLADLLGLDVEEQEV